MTIILDQLDLLRSSLTSALAEVEGDGEISFPSNHARSELLSDLADDILYRSDLYDNCPADLSAQDLRSEVLDFAKLSGYRISDG